MPVAADAPGRLDPSTHRVFWCCSGPCGSQDRFHCSRVSIRRGGESVPWLLLGLQAKPRSCCCPSASCCQAWKIVSGTECLTIIWSAEINFTSIVPNAAKSMIYGGKKTTFSPARETSCIQVSCLICHPHASHTPSLHGFVQWMGRSLKVGFLQFLLVTDDHRASQRGGCNAESCAGCLKPYLVQH